MCQNLPGLCSKVMEMVAQICRAEKVKFMSWNDFLSTVKGSLAEHVDGEQLRISVEYLHNISELLYFPNVSTSQGSENGLVILDLKWFCQDILGTFGNIPLNSLAPHDCERWRRGDLESRLKLDRSWNIGDVLSLLEQLELLFACPGTDEYIVPAWLQKGRAAHVWEDANGPDSQKGFLHSASMPITFCESGPKVFVYHGLVFRWKPETGFFSQAFFARLQLRLVKHFTGPMGERFLIWKDGIKCVDEAEVLVQVTEVRLSVNVIVRGYQEDSMNGSIASDTRSKCWALLQAVGEHIEKLLSETGAEGNCSRLYLSPSGLRSPDCWSRELTAYTFDEVLEAVEKQETLCNKQAGVQDPPLRILMAGYDVTVLTRLKHSASVLWLRADTLCQLCSLLDPEHPTGKDWRALMEKVSNATHLDIQILDSQAHRSKCSPTLSVFNQYPEMSIDQLYQALRDIEREDCLYELDSMLKSLEE